MHLHWSDLIYFFVGVVIPTYNLLDWISQHFGKLIKRLLVRSQSDAVAWLHYKKHVAKDGHVPKQPVDCTDGDCDTIKA